MKLFSNYYAAKVCFSSHTKCMWVGLGQIYQFSFSCSEIILHSSKGNLQVLEKRLKQSPKPDVKDLEEALLVAIKNGHDDCIPILVVSGARRLDCPLYLAIQLEQIKSIAILLLCKSVISGSTDAIRSLLSEPPQTGNVPWYIPKVHRILSQGQVKMSFPIAVSIMVKNYEATKELLLRTDLDMRRKQVDWSKLKLTVLHSSWMYSIAPWVVTLKLVNNHLRALPQDICNAVQIRRLDLSQNLLETVPVGLFALPNLEYLSLGHNRLKEIQETTNWTPSLLSFDLSENNLTTLPPGIQYSSIEILNLSKNQFNSVPKCICRIRTLTSLDLSHMPITSFPKEMELLDHLVNLNVSNVSVSDLPGGGGILRGGIRGIFKARARSNKPCNYVKLMLLCHSDTVKNVMLSRLKPHGSSNIPIQMPDIDLFQWSYKPIFTRKLFVSPKLHFNTWLIGSSYECRSIYPCLFTSSALYVIVWDLIKTADMREQIKIYVDLLVRHIPKANVLVITILPESYEAWADANSENLARRLNVFFNKHCYKSLIYHGLMMVVANPNLKEGQADIKQRLYDVASSMTVNGQQHIARHFPENYFSLIPALEKRQKHFQVRGQAGIMLESDIWALFDRTLASDSPDKMELPVMVEFLQETGYLLHFEDPNDRLDQFYFTLPVWLYTTFLRILKHVLQHSSRVVLSQAELNSLINATWSTEVSAALIRLMVRFAMVLPVNSNHFLATCLLPHCNPPSSDLYCGNLRRQFAPKVRGIPNDLWNRLICRVLSNIPRIVNMSQVRKKGSLTHLPESEPLTKREEGTDDETDEHGIRPNSKRSTLERFHSEPSLDSPTMKSSDRESESPDKEDGSQTDHMSPVNTDDSQATGETNGADIAVKSDESAVKDESALDRSFARLLVRKSQAIEESFEKGSPSDATPTSDKLLSTSGTLGNSQNSNSDSKPVTPEGDNQLEMNGQDLNQSSNDHKELEQQAISSLEKTTDSNSSQKPTGSNSLPRQKKKGGSKLDTGTELHITPASLKARSETETELQRLPAENNSEPAVTAKPSPKVETRQKIETSESGRHSSLPEHTVRARFQRNVSLPPRKRGDLTRRGTMVEPVCIEKGVYLWDSGMIFDRKGIKFAIFPSLSEVSTVDEKGIEVCSTKDNNGRIVMARLCRVIQKLLEERYPEIFSAHLDLQRHELTQLAICPLCLDSYEKNPTSFLVEACVHACQVKAEHNCRYHPQSVPLHDLIPDYLMVDFPYRLHLSSTAFQYNEAKPLHRGRNTYLHQGTFQDNDVAVKVYHQLDGKSITFPLSCIRQEIDMLSSLDHPNIVKTFGFCLQPACVLLEKAPLGNLYQKLNDTEQKISRSVRFHICTQVASALEYLHSQDIVYRTLKASSILVWSLDFHDEVNIKLANFERAEFLSPSGLLGRTSFASYPAPEMLRYSFREEYTEKVDIYSFGILLYELVTRWQPFAEMSSIVSRRPKLSGVVTTGYNTLVKLMEDCWQEDLTRRLSASLLTRRLSQPAFQCHLSTQLLRDCVSVRNCCFVPSVRQIWVYGEYSKVNHFGGGAEGEVSEGTQVFILNADNLSVQGTLEFKERASALFTVDNKVWIGMTEACVHAYDTTTFHFTDRLHVDDSVTVVANNDSYVFVGQANGHLKCYSKLYLQGVHKEPKSIDIEIGDKPILVMMTVGDIIWLSCGNELVILDAEDDNIEIEARWEACEPNDQVYALVISKDSSIVWSLVRGSQTITSWDVHTGKKKCTTDLSEELKWICCELNYDPCFLRLVSLECVRDTLWLGLTCGVIVILTTSENPKMVTYFLAHKSATKCLLLVPSEEDSSQQDSTVVLSGGYGEVSSLATSTTEQNGVIMSWHALSADEFRVVARRYSKYCHENTN